MDVINEREVYDKIVSPALEKINNETIPTAERTIQRQVEAAKSQFAGFVSDALISVSAIADKLVADVHREVNALDGWTVVIDEIRIPPISIRLSKPKE